MSLKNLNDLIKKYEDVRKQVDSMESRRRYGPYATSDSLCIVNEFIKDLKEVRNEHT